MQLLVLLRFIPLYQPKGFISRSFLLLKMYLFNVLFPVFYCVVVLQIGCRKWVVIGRASSQPMKRVNFSLISARVMVAKIDYKGTSRSSLLGSTLLLWGCWCWGFRTNSAEFEHLTFGDLPLLVSPSPISLFIPEELSLLS